MNKKNTENDEIKNAISQKNCLIKTFDIYKY